MNKTNTIYAFIICLVAIGIIAGCKDNQEPKVYNHSKAMIVLENAEEPFYVLNDGGSIQLTYKIREDYPAESVIKEITDKLKVAEWQPRNEDYLNPGHFMSHFEGWSEFEDAVRPPTKAVHQWMGDWEDKYGNIVRYVFRYAYPKSDKKDLSNLQIHAIYTPASLVDVIKTELNANDEQ